MTASIATAPTAPSRKPVATNVPIGGVLGSEWTKLRSVRSTYWTLLATIGAMIGFAALISSAIVSRWNHIGHGPHFGFESGAASLRGLYIAQLAIGVLGALAITAEHTTGSIRNTFAATPQRRTVLLSKTAVFGTVALIVCLIGSFSAFAVGQAIFGPTHQGLSLNSSQGLRIAICGGLYLAMVGLLGLGIGALIRHTAGAVATLFGVVLVLPALASALPTPWNTDVSKVLPSEAGQAMLLLSHGKDTLSPLLGGLVMLAYVVVAIAAATVSIHLRDA